MSKSHKKIFVVQSIHQTGNLFITFKIIVRFTIELIAPSGLIYESQYHSYTEDGIKISILDFKLLAIQILYIFTIRSIIKFNTNYYHQYLSYCRIFIGILFVSFPGINEEVNLEFKIPSYCGLYILIVLQRIMEKWVMDMKHIRDHLLLLLEGLFNTVFGYHSLFLILLIQIPFLILQ